MIFCVYAEDGADCRGMFKEALGGYSWLKCLEIRLVGGWWGVWFYMLLPRFVTEYMSSFARISVCDMTKACNMFKLMAFSFEIK